MKSLNASVRVTQMTASEAFVADHETDIRFDLATGTWFTYTNKTGWRADESGVALQERLKQTLAQLKKWVPAEASLIETNREATKRAASVERLETAGAFNSILMLASKAREVHLTANEIDSVPSLLGSPNGLIDLRTGRLCGFTRGVVITRRTTEVHLTAHPCHRWKRFLEEVFGLEDGVQDYIQQLIGYVITGETSIEQMWLLVGDGSNGKSTFLRVLQELLGNEYAQQTPESVLLGKPTPGQASSELARLKGVRPAVLHETDKSHRLNETRVKSLVSGDKVAARHLYRDYEEFYPQAKFFLATNHLPNVTGSDHGIWRRLVVIPFNAQFEVGMDSTLRDDLRAEMPGILAWAVEGARKWYENGKQLQTPNTFMLRTDAYKAEQDSVSRFLDETTSQMDGEKVTLHDAYRIYTTWCEDEGRTPLTKSELGERIERSGRAVKKKFGKQHKVHLFGIRFINAPMTTVQVQNDERPEGNKTKAA